MWETHREGGREGGRGGRDATEKKETNQGHGTTADMKCSCACCHRPKSSWENGTTREKRDATNAQEGRRRQRLTCQATEPDEKLMAQLLTTAANTQRLFLQTCLSIASQDCDGCVRACLA